MRVRNPVCTLTSFLADKDYGAKGYIDLSITRSPKGPMSQHIHGLKVGQEPNTKRLIATYPMKSNQYRHTAMIAGGTGITPMWQTARRIFKDPTDNT